MDVPASQAHEILGQVDTWTSHLSEPVRGNHDEWCGTVADSRRRILWTGSHRCRAGAGKYGAH